MNKSPCLNCDTRREDCHAWCVDYREYDELQVRIRQARKEEKLKVEYLIDATERMQRLRRSR